MRHPACRAALAGALLASLSSAHAAEGVDRAASGVKETVTSPGKVFDEIEADTREHGAVGVVTGSLKGGAKAAGQAVKGAADIGVGVIETLTEPFKD